MKVDLTADGYLQDLQSWTPEVAEWLAAKQNISLTPDHWEIIYLLRDFYDQYQTSPSIRALVNSVKEKLGPDKGNSIYLLQLFPGGPAIQATLIAGLPKPIRCV